MVDKELLLTGGILLIEPELGGRDDRKFIVLPEIREFLVELLPDVAAVDDPDVETIDLAGHPDIRFSRDGRRLEMGLEASGTAF
jgi:hypothetical protein